jgi:hypothetical protein
MALNGCAKQAAHVVVQFLEFEGFGNETVGTHGHALAAPNRRAARRHHQDLHIARGLVEPDCPAA